MNQDDDRHRYEIERAKEAGLRGVPYINHSNPQAQQTYERAKATGESMGRFKRNSADILSGLYELWRHILPYEKNGSLNTLFVFGVYVIVPILMLLRIYNWGFLIALISFVSFLIFRYQTLGEVDHGDTLGLKGRESKAAGIIMGIISLAAIGYVVYRFTDLKIAAISVVSIFLYVLATIYIDIFVTGFVRKEKGKRLDRKKKATRYADPEREALYRKRLKELTGKEYID